MVMSDCEEFRYLKTDKPGEEREVKRTLGKLNSYMRLLYTKLLDMSMSEMIQIHIVGDHDANQDFTLLLNPD
jgi:hypothetical protein